MHCGCVLVVAVVMVCDSGRRDRQGSGGEGWEHVGESRWMKDWGSGRRGEGTAAVCHVVVVVSVWSWLLVSVVSIFLVWDILRVGCSDAWIG